MRLRIAAKKFRVTDTLPLQRQDVAGKWQHDHRWHPEQREDLACELPSTSSGLELVESSRTDLASELRRIFVFAQHDDNVAMFDRLGVLVRRARVARLRAMITAENLAVGLNAVADHATVTMATLRRKRVNGALETVEDMFARFTFNNHLKGLRVIVSTDFTACHDRPPNSFGIKSTNSLGLKSRNTTGAIPVPGSGAYSAWVGSPRLCYNPGHGKSKQIPAPSEAANSPAVRRWRQAWHDHHPTRRSADHHPRDGLRPRSRRGTED
jgi:hypothetical protein